jgi:quinol monooxygenase YgiN
MVMLFARHKVEDYGRWKRVYDEVGSIRKKMGVTAASVLRDGGNPNLIIITHQFKDTNAARAFADSEELKSAMERAGVSGAPEMWFGEEIEKTPF